jgi:hypothetical protein
LLNRTVRGAVLIRGSDALASTNDQRKPTRRIGCEYARRGEEQQAAYGEN